MTRRLVAAALAAGALLAGGCGDDEESAGVLTWAGEPRILQPPTLPDDRILSGRIRNDSLEMIELRAADLELRDGSGAALDASAFFLEGYVKPLEARNRPSQETDAELRRRGLAARIEPGKTAPLTLSWHQRPGTSPQRIDYGAGSLPLP